MFVGVLTESVLIFQDSCNEMCAVGAKQIRFVKHLFLDPQLQTANDSNATPLIEIHPRITIAQWTHHSRLPSYIQILHILSTHSNQHIIIVIASGTT